MAQDPSEAAQAAMLLKLLQQQQQGNQNDAPKGPTWQVVCEVVNRDSKASTMTGDEFNKTITGQHPILSNKYVTNQIDGGADLLLKLQFSEKIKIETITFYCKPHTSTDSNTNDSNNNNGSNDNSNNNENNNESNENKENNNENNNENTENNEENEEESESKPECPRRLYFAKSAETLSNYFENDINSRNDSLDGLNLIKFNEKAAQSDSGFTVSFLKKRPSVYKGTGLRQNVLIIGLTHEPVKLEEDDEEETDIDMDGEEKYQAKSIYISGIVIKAAGQMSSKQDFQAQMKSIEKIKKGD